MIIKSTKPVEVTIKMSPNNDIIVILKGIYIKKEIDDNGVIVNEEKSKEIIRIKMFESTDFEKVLTQDVLNSMSSLAITDFGWSEG